MVGGGDQLYNNIKNLSLLLGRIKRDARTDRDPFSVYYI